jgi:hypothetical protein
MSMTITMLGCLLIGQALNPSTPASPLAPTTPALPSRSRTGEMVAAAVQLPSGSAIGGQPYSLLSAVSSTVDRRQQIEIVRAYWRLFEAAAEYRYSWDYAQQLETIRSRSIEDTLLRRARAAAVAQLREAELAAVSAQHQLAALVRLPAGGSLPLPSDRPCIAVYNTRLQQIFPNRTPPDGARLADKILPLQRRVIEDRAAAVQAADDALQTLADDSRYGRGDAAATAACGRELLRQRLAFIRSVCDYNRTIGDFSLSVVGLSISPQELVESLIGKTQSATPAGGEPTPADPKRRPPGNEPAPTAPRNDWHQSNGSFFVPQRDGEQSAGRNETASELPQNVPLTASRKQPATLDSSSIPPIPRTAYKPPFHAAASSVRQLADEIFGDGRSVEGMGRPIGLSDGLVRDAGGDRLGTIQSYWRLRRRMVQCQVRANQTDALTSLSGAVSKHSFEPSGRADGLRLEASRLAARADASQSTVSLVEAQFDLARRIGAAAETDWPLASTTPFMGRYFRDQPNNIVNTWPMRRLTTTIAAMPENLQQFASAVVEADAARTATIDHYAATGAAFHQVLQAIDEQTELTFKFLESLTAYNQAIAEYALAVLPPNAPADRLMKSLVGR